MLYKSDIRKISIRLIIWDFDCQPEEITNYLGIQPSEIRIKGETRLVGKIKHPMLNKMNAWIIESDLPKSAEPDKHIENILNKIRPHKNKFIELAKKYDADLSFGIFWDYCNPGITFDKEILKEFAELNIEVGFDMYYLPDDLVLENTKNKNKLIEQLQNVPLLKQYSSDKHNEAKVLVESLAIIEDECDRVSGMIIPDLIWDNLDEDDWNFRLNKLSTKLKEIKNAINKSVFLKKNT